jgi:threonine/homoserine/homoserine lactone efflux protein
MAASLAQAGHDQPRREGYVIEAVIAGVLAGYAIAIPVGAIAVLIIHVAIQDGVRAGLAAGAGAASADGIYALVAVVAGVAAAQFLGELQDPLRLIGGAVLLGIGLRGLTALRSPREAAPAPVLRAGRNRRTFLVVLGLTLLNPVTVVYFAALVVGLPELGGPAESAAFVGAVFVASLTWQSLLAGIGALLGRGPAHRLRRPTTILGSLVILGFGVFVLWQALSG